MIKNDITYEYRVFTNRIVDIDSMEVGICTNSVLNKLKPKDKVNGRFYHTSDTDEWFFCWNGEMQKLNLKGDADVNAALEQVKKLISDANAAVSDAKSTAKEAKIAAEVAKTAADNASAAVESIENKADKSVVNAISDKVNTKADQSVVDDLSQTVGAKADKTVVNELSKKVEDIVVPTKVSQLQNDKNYLTEHQDISGKQDVIEDLEDIRSNASLGKTALQEVPSEYITETELNEKGYLTSQSLEGYAKTEDIPSLENVALKSELPIMENYYTKEEIDNLIGVATNITNTILS